MRTKLEWPRVEKRDAKTPIPGVKKGNWSNERSKDGDGGPARK